MSKLTIKFILCERCNNIMVAGPDSVKPNMRCGWGCGGELKEISKQEAHKISEEKLNEKL